MGAMKTPGVYIVEKNAFPNSVVEVATAVPAFIGYTEKADNKGKPLSNQPWRITSMAEFENYFGKGPAPKFSFTNTAPAPVAPATTAPEPSFSLPDGKGKRTNYWLTQEEGRFLLYYSMQLFYQNGGGPCYIVSVGDYSGAVEAKKLTDGIMPLVKEQEPTIVVIPDAVLLKQDECIGVEQQMLDHCGNVMKNRVAILDVSDGYRSRQDPAGDPVNTFRDSLGINFLDFGMAYYPWLNTTITSASNLNCENLSDAARASLHDLLKAELDIDNLPKEKAEQMTAIIDGVKHDHDWTKDAKYPQQPTDPAKKLSDSALKALQDNFVLQSKLMLHKSLVALSPNYNMILTEIANVLNLLPPAAAMAGVYTMVDDNRGVWKAPANVSLNSVTSPAVNITHGDQEDLNVTPQGKSINAIRPFVGEGTLVWGARTLDGNSLDWRYINVRRTMIMLEESIRLASKAYVFEPNVANTWVTIKSMIRNFLTGVWKKGGLAGAVPDDAFAVFCGLGETMTPEDILEGVL
ncbi:MAG TPA: phage tail sheath C-terminal domain-containing protein, partial [Gallionella sp.]|nr:phage tail sheath C-terminal domain-containing protein [Gallionella sp.]